MIRPLFADGTPFDTTNFEFLDKSRRITVDEKRGIILAWDMCATAPGCSIILVKRESIVATAIGCVDFESALTAVRSQHSQLFRRNDRFRSFIVAVLTIAPDHAQAQRLAPLGVDAIFAPAHHGPDASDKEKDLRFSWFGDEAQHRGGYQKHSLIRPRYQLLRVKGEGDDVLEAARRKASS